MAKNKQFRSNWEWLKKSKELLDTAFPDSEQRQPIESKGGTEDLFVLVMLLKPSGPFPSQSCGSYSCHLKLSGCESEVHSNFLLDLSLCMSSSCEKHQCTILWQNVSIDTLEKSKCNGASAEDIISAQRKLHIFILADNLNNAMLET